MLALLVAIIAMALLAGTAYVFREDLVGLWLRRNLASRLSSALGADVSLDGVRWRAGVLHAGRAGISGGHLPFAGLTAARLRTDVDWERMFGPVQDAMRIVADDVEVTLGGTPGEVVRDAAGTGAAGAWPVLDFAVARFSMRDPGSGGWEVKETTLEARHEGGAWSFSGRGGSAVLPDFPPLRMEKFTALHRGASWSIESFVLADRDGGSVRGAAAFAGGQWSADFSWQNVKMATLLPGAAAGHFDGRSSGSAKWDDGILRGTMTIAGAETREISPLVKMASLFTGEKWDTLPWETLVFDFVREPDGTVSLTKLRAVSTKGIAVTGAGRMSPQAIEADLQLGVKRQGRPWLVAFMPVLFRTESDGYFWTPVHVSGTPQEPKEDLTTRVVAALAVAPATGAVETMTELPGAAAEAAGNLLESLMGR